MSVRLDPRLEAAASFVRRGSVLADVGTDHAYLPVHLLTEGIARFALAADVNRGPLGRADGLVGAEPERDGVTDIAVCGMGGELIARIVGASDYTKKPGVRLILQPMSSPAELRTFLAENGYRILDERLAESAGKIYACLLAEYDGEARAFTPAELLLGRANIEKMEPLFPAFARVWLNRLSVEIEGRRRGDLDTREAEALRDEIGRILGS